MYIISYPVEQGAYSLWEILWSCQGRVPIVDIILFGDAVCLSSVWKTDPFATGFFQAQGKSCSWNLTNGFPFAHSAHMRNIHCDDYLFYKLSCNSNTYNELQIDPVGLAFIL